MDLLKNGDCSLKRMAFVSLKYAKYYSLQTQSIVEGPLGCLIDSSYHIKGTSPRFDWLIWIDHQFEDERLLTSWSWPSNFEIDLSKNVT